MYAALPVGYVHLVFTMPEPLARLALVTKRVVYDLLLLIRVLRKLFRGKLLASLTAACREGRLDFPGTLAPLKPEAAFRAFLRSLSRQTWIVAVPHATPAHRVAISNHRLVDVTDDGKTHFHGTLCPGTRLRSRRSLP